MRDAAIAEVLHDETAVLEGVDVFSQVYPANLGHLSSLVLVVGGAVSLTHEQVAVIFCSNEPNKDMNILNLYFKSQNTVKLAVGPNLTK